MSKHAILSASSAERWINCPPSARINASKKSEPSRAALEGTVAHELAEIKLIKAFQNSKKRVPKKLKDSEFYDKDMETHTDTYLEYVTEVYNDLKTKKGENPEVKIEAKLDYSEYAPEGFGTGDAVIICGSEIHVIDFKYGRGVHVAAENNAQLKLYALGAYLEESLFQELDEVHMHIVQPRRDNIDSASLSTTELLAWAEEIKPLAELAYDGSGDYKSGDHCKFCKNIMCYRRAADALKLVLENEDLAEIQEDALSNILKVSSMAKSFFEGMEKHAVSEMLKGRKIKDFKLVEGVTKRVITDQEALVTELEQGGLSRDSLYESKLKGIGALTKLAGAPLSEVLNKYVEKPKGAPKIEPADSKKPEYATAEADFEGL